MIIMNCLQCGRLLCTETNFCDARCRHRYDLRHHGDGRPEEIDLTLILTLSVKIVRAGVKISEVRNLIVHMKGEHECP